MNRAELFFYLEFNDHNRPPREYEHLLVFEGKTPDEIIRTVADNLVHIWSRAGKEHYGNIVETSLPRTTKIYEMLATGTGGYSFGRSDQKKLGFTENPLAVYERVPHTCIGISAVVSAALIKNAVPARCRYIATKVPDKDDNKYRNHWAVEYWNGEQWVLRDPSFHEHGYNVNPDHMFSWQVYELSKEAPELMEDFAVKIGQRSVEAHREKVIPIKFLFYDSLAVAEGPFLPWLYDKAFDGIEFSESTSDAEIAGLYDEYGQGLNDAIKGLDEPDGYNKFQSLVDSCGIGISDRSGDE